MGRLVTLKCRKCGYETNLSLGAGMLYFDIHNVIDLFDLSTRETILHLLEKNPDSVWNVTKEIGVCEKCGKISAIAVFKMTVPDGKEVEYKASCPCGGVVEIKDTEKILSGEGTICCPSCDKKLEFSVTGLWD